MVDKTIECVFLMWSTAEEMAHSLRQCSRILQQQGRSVGTWLSMACREFPERYVSLLSATHSILPFSESIHRLLGFLIGIGIVEIV